MTIGQSGHITVLLIDDHPIVRTGFRIVLEEGDQLKVIGEGETGLDAVRLAERLRPDVIFMDISMPDMDGLEATRRIKAQNPAARILIVSAHSDEEYVLGALEAGASGYLLKRCPPHELRGAVSRIHAGERVLHHSLVQTLIAKAVNRPAPAVKDSLSEREREVLQLLAEGATSKEIAMALGLKPKTVENHRARILDKLGVTNSAAAVRAAVAAGLVGSEKAPRHRWDYALA
jgi:DNA-binding NarL/FixJ family response regulator